MFKVLQPSTAFKDYYAIFISRSASGMFDEYIRSRLWKVEYGIRVIHAEFDPELSCILIPNHLNLALFEDALFKIKLSDKRSEITQSQFWGQTEIGYEGQYWTLI